MPNIPLEPVESLDAVDSQYHGYFEQTDDGFVLREDVRPLAEQVNSLASNLDSARSNLKKVNNEAAERRLTNKQFQEVLDSVDELEEKNPEALRSYIENLRGQAAKGGKSGEEAEKRIKAIRDEMSQRFEAERQELTGRTEKLQSALERTLVDREAVSAIAAEKGVDALLLPHIKSQTKVVEENGQYQVQVVDGEGNVRYNGHGNPMTIKELVRSMKDDPVFGRAFESTMPSGSGTAPGSTRTAPAGRGEENLSPTERIARGLRNGRK